MKCNSIIKKYPTGLVKVKKTKFNFDVGSRQRKDLRYCDNSDYSKALEKKYLASRGEDFDFESYSNEKAKDFMIKTKENIYDIANCNSWNYFITLTYSSKKCDRYSFEECSKKARQFMNNFKKRKDNDLKYLLVHEMHKDGAYHFHGLINLSDDSHMLDSGKRDSKDRVIYNWISWKNGFSTATKIDDLDACRNYILKYIEKDIDKDYVKGQRRYYYSQNCLKPEREVALDYSTFGMDLAYESQYSIGYQTEKSLSQRVYDKLGIDIEIEE